METLLEYIHAALANDATPDARAAGAQACRTILASLEATAGEPVPSVAAATASPLVQPAVVQAAVTALRGMSVDQLLELAITRLRAVVPPGTEVAAMPGVKFHLINHPSGR